MSEPDRLIWDLHAALYAAHPTSGMKQQARVWLEHRYHAVPAEAWIETLKANHTLWIEHWRKERAERPNSYIPYLVKWLESEEWMDPPKDGVFHQVATVKPKTVNRKDLPR